MNYYSPSPSELKAHQIAFYTQRMKDATSDRERAFLRAQLHGLKKDYSPKKYNNVSLFTTRSVSRLPVPSLQECRSN